MWIFLTFSDVGANTVVHVNACDRSKKKSEPKEILVVKYADTAQEIEKLHGDVKL